jgi:hypothetical protein
MFLSFEIRLVLQMMLSHQHFIERVFPSTALTINFACHHRRVLQRLSSKKSLSLSLGKISKAYRASDGTLGLQNA